ncbi:Elongator complex protein 3 [Beauveria bassiana]|nr:Elongator complex protein 3 [Beauveria bassiana]
MATATVTVTAAATAKKKAVDLAPESERYLRCCADVANTLIEDHEASKNGRPSRDINLNSLRNKLAKKHKLTNIPPLTAIIAAIPEHYKKYILHKLIAKPIPPDASSAYDDDDAASDSSRRYPGENLLSPGLFLRKKKKKTYVLHNANVVDAANGSIVPRQTVVLRDGLIDSVQPTRSYTHRILPASAEDHAVADVADSYGTYVTAHAYTPRAIRHAVDNGVGGIEHSNLLDADTARAQTSG